MARKRYYSGGNGGFAPVQQPIPAHPVLGAIVYLIISVFACGALIVGCGPILDYFGMYLSSMPADAAPYASPTLELFPWAYTFIMLLGAVALVGVFLAVIRQIYYSRYGD